ARPRPGVPEGLFPGVGCLRDSVCIDGEQCPRRAAEAVAVDARRGGRSLGKEPELDGLRDLDLSLHPPRLGQALHLERELHVTGFETAINSCLPNARRGSPSEPPRENPRRNRLPAPPGLAEPSA